MGRTSKKVANRLENILLELVCPRPEHLDVISLITIYEIRPQDI